MFIFIPCSLYHCHVSPTSNRFYGFEIIIINGMDGQWMNGQINFLFIYFCANYSRNDKRHSYNHIQQTTNEYYYNCLLLFSLRSLLVFPFCFVWCLDLIKYFYSIFIAFLLHFYCILMSSFGFYVRTDRLFGVCGVCDKWIRFVKALNKWDMF